MKKTSTLWWFVGIVVFAVAMFAWSNIVSHTKNASRTNREVALLCTTDMATQFHIHPALKIIVRGKEQAIPANIGIQPACMNSIHTHDSDGTLHIEAPEKRDFTLADFFAVWDKPFTKDQILDYKADATHQIRVTVNGTQVDTYENTILRDKDRIIISYEIK